MTTAEFTMMPAPKRRKLFLRVATGANKMQKELVTENKRAKRATKKRAC